MQGSILIKITFDKKNYINRMVSRFRTSKTSDNGSASRQLLVDFEELNMLHDIRNSAGKHDSFETENTDRQKTENTDRQKRDSTDRESSIEDSTITA